MNQQFRNKRQSFKVTDKQAGVGKSYKMSFKALQVEIHLKYSGQKTDREGQCAPLPRHRVKQYKDGKKNAEIKKLLQDPDNILTQDKLFVAFLLVTVCYCHPTCAFQCEFILHSCSNVKEVLARNRLDIWSLSDSNKIWTHNHLGHKRTLNCTSLVKWLSVRFWTNGCGFKFRCCHLNPLVVFEWWMNKLSHFSLTLEF